MSNTCIFATVGNQVLTRLLLSRPGIRDRTSCLHVYVVVSPHARFRGAIPIFMIFLTRIYKNARYGVNTRGATRRAHAPTIAIVAPESHESAAAERISLRELTTRQLASQHTNGSQNRFFAFLVSTTRHFLLASTRQLNAQSQQISIMTQ